MRSVLLLMVLNSLSAQNGFVTIRGELPGWDDVSAIEKIHDFYVIATDEAVGPTGADNVVYLLKNRVSGWAIVNTITVRTGTPAEGEELDIEAMAVDGSDLYVIGSHSNKRKKFKSDKPSGKNTKNLLFKHIEDEQGRDYLIKLTINRDGEVTGRTEKSLRSFLRQHNVLKGFVDIPSKENGVDIEGLAFHNGYLYAGFRGPVFRQNFVPILKFKFDAIEDSAELLYVNLSGMGIRSLTATDGGFYLITGPVGDAQIPGFLYHWDGKTMLGGVDQSPGKTILIKRLDGPAGAKAEGLVFESATVCFVVFDSAPSINQVVQRISLNR